MLFLQVQYTNGDDMITGQTFLTCSYVHSVHLIYNCLCTNKDEFVIDFVGQQSKYNKN